MIKTVLSFEKCIVQSSIGLKSISDALGKVVNRSLTKFSTERPMIFRFYYTCTVIFTINLNFCKYFHYTQSVYFRTEEFLSPIIFRGQ